MSIVTAVLGFSLIVSGTLAYFNDTEGTINTFATGLLDLGINKETIIQIDKIVPGDTINGDFELTNDGTVDMKEVILHTTYEVVDIGKINGDDDLGNHISVEFINHVSGKEKVLFKRKLSELNDNPIQILEQFPEKSKAEKFTVRFTFVDNEGNQNHFQEDSIKLKWEFEAIQRDGNPDFQ